MKSIDRSVLVFLIALSACAKDTPPPATPAPAPKPAEAPAKPAEPAAKTPPAPAEAPKAPASVDIDTANRELMAKSEQPDAQIEIQHVLISFKGAPKMMGVT